ncbi:porin family protein [Geotalea sp. SG265]|uniref:porin family protein n=1 Tax=Geotalea sp. SG265 TaxID=2922867 RepID=UPI001FB002F3|nr:porin family protein [Geotalea sp. SG265]
MRKRLFVTAIALVAMLAGSNAMAENLRGKVGLTGRLGAIFPADSERNHPDGKLVVETDPGFIGGGGLFYGVDDHVALELNVDHSLFHTKGWSDKSRRASMNDVSIGAQYRFNDRNDVVPYLGGGIDILIPELDDLQVDTVLGLHIAAGIDFFVSRNVAFTAELKGLGAFDADVNRLGAKIGNYDPSNISTTVGLRLFFN